MKSTVDAILRPASTLISASVRLDLLYYELSVFNFFLLENFFIVFISPVSAFLQRTTYLIWAKITIPNVLNITYTNNRVQGSGPIGSSKIANIRFA